MNAAPLIAIDVILLYTLLGPAVLFAVFVLFDAITWKKRSGRAGTRRASDPALWTAREIDAFLDRI
jgi:hypothetical protein